MFLETKLDDGNIFFIGRVLEIKAHELVFFLRLFKPSLEIGNEILHLGAVVGVDDTEIGRAMCAHISVQSYWIHGGRWGRRERETMDQRMKMRRYCSRVFLIARGMRTVFGQEALIPVCITNRD